MTAEEVVMSAYQAFGAGDMEALAKLNHPECTTHSMPNMLLAEPITAFQPSLKVS